MSSRYELGEAAEALEDSCSKIVLYRVVQAS